jgi:ankyrin repeat protein
MSHEHKSCNCLLANPTSTAQNLDELEFERSICGAALDRDVERVKQLIGKGRINDRDHYGYNALAYAARNGDIAMCCLLIDHGIDVNVGTLSGNRPLHRAAMMGHHEIVKLLLDNKACPRVVDDSGQTALHRGVKFVDVVKHLLNADETLKFVKDQKGRLPIDLLLDSSDSELKLLLSCNP